MKSPWTKKNPWLSMYLSGFNSVAGSVRGQAAAAAKRQASAAMAYGMKQWADAWVAALSSLSSPKRKGRRR
jgi:hypothetical protein